MRRTFLIAAVAGSVAVSGCAGYGLGGLLGGDGYGDDYGYGYNQNSEFERAAVRACGREASRYGRVSISRAEPRDRDYYYVEGRTDNRDRDLNEFKCLFGSNGRIADFDMY